MKLAKFSKLSKTEYMPGCHENTVFQCTYVTVQLSPFWSVCPNVWIRSFLNEIIVVTAIPLGWHRLSFEVHQLVSVSVMATRKVQSRFQISGDFPSSDPSMQSPWNAITSHTIGEPNICRWILQNFPTNSPTEYMPNRIYDHEPLYTASWGARRGPTPQWMFCFLISSLFRKYLPFTGGR